MNVGTLFTKSARTFPERLAIAYGNYELTYKQANERMKHLTSAGIPRTDVEVKIVNGQDEELPPGQMGEIVVRGEVVMKGYWRNPQATAETLRGGWLHTGDLGMMDEKGYVYILDRAKDMIISGGENIYSREIEDVILRHPAVHEVAVIGVPDEVWGRQSRRLWR